MFKQEKKFPVPALQDTPVVVAELQKLVDDHEDRLRKLELRVVTRQDMINGAYYGR